MNQSITKITINGESYVREADLASSPSMNTEGMPCVIVSCGASGGGIHFGFLKSKSGNEVTLLDSRRIQYWNGAASISEMAVRGVSKPNDCRFAPIVPEITLIGVVEIIPTSTKAWNNLRSVPIWTR